MKKILVVTPAFLLLAACASNPAVNSNPESTFTCEDKGQVKAAYSDNGQVANLNVNLSKISLSNKSVTLNQAVSGSGARYTNNSDPKMSYDWYTKADYGIMKVSMHNGQEYSVNCKL